MVVDHRNTLPDFATADQSRAGWSSALLTVAVTPSGVVSEAVALATVA
jgi:hypothetical protein